MKLLRINQVLEKIPISRSSWYEGIREGRYPPGFKLSPRVRVWPENKIDEVIAGRTDLSTPNGEPFWGVAACPGCHIKSAKGSDSP